MTRTKDFMDKLEAKLDDWEDQAERLKDQAKTKLGLDDASIAAELQEVEEGRATLKGRLLKFKENSEEAMDDLEDGLEDAWDKVEAGLKKAWSRFD